MAEAIDKIRIKRTVYEKKPWRVTKKLIRQYWIYYLFFLPVAVYLIVFAYIPMLGIQIAFKDYSFKLGIWGSPWTSEHGFHHFIRFLSNGEFYRVVKNTMIMNVLGTFLGFPVPIIFALLINEIKLPHFKKFLQSVSYLPHFVSFVVVYAILFNFFSYDGFINTLRFKLGAEERIMYLGSRPLYKWLYVLSGIWQGMGWGSIIYLAALSRVDVELYEAADIDGAGRFSKMWYITVGEIRPLISLNLIMSIGGIFGAGSLGKTLAMMNDQVRPVAENLSYYVYYTGLKQVNQYSYAAAVGLFLAMFSLGITLFVNWLAKKVDEDGGLF